MLCDECVEKRDTFVAAKSREKGVCLGRTSRSVNGEDAVERELYRLGLTYKRLLHIAILQGREAIEEWLDPGGSHDMRAQLD